MKRRRPCCSSSNAYELAEGRRKCRDCGHRYSWTSVWDSIRLPVRTEGRLLEMFVLGVPLFRQRFGAPASATSMERFYRRCRACCAWEEQLHVPIDGALE